MKMRWGVKNGQDGTAKIFDNGKMWWYDKVHEAKVLRETFP